MNKIDEINNNLKKIANGIGWCTIWLFFIMLGTCSNPSITINQSDSENTEQYDTR